MVIMLLDGISLSQAVFMGKVCGDAFTNDGEDFIIIFHLRLVFDVPAKGWKIQARNNKKREGSGDARAGCRGRTAVRNRQ